MNLKKLNIDFDQWDELDELDINKLIFINIVIRYSNMTSALKIIDPFFLRKILDFDVITITTLSKIDHIINHYYKYKNNNYVINLINELYNYTNSHNKIKFYVNIDEFKRKLNKKYLSLEYLIDRNKILEYYNKNFS
jgi:hypothetical protein